MYGRVGDHQVDGAVELGQCVRQVAGSRVTSVPARLRPAQASGVVGDLDRVHHGAGHLGGQRFAIAPEPVPRSTATGRRPVASDVPAAGHRPAGHHLGLRPRDEHPGSDGELEVAEVGPTGQVLQRDPLGPPLDQRREAAGVCRVDLDRCHRRVRRPQPQLCASSTRASSRGCRPRRPRSRRGRHSATSSLDARAHRSTGPISTVRRASRSAVSASCRAAITACRSPFSTCRGCRP